MDTKQHTRSADQYVHTPRSRPTENETSRAKTKIVKTPQPKK